MKRLLATIILFAGLAVGLLAQSASATAGENVQLSSFRSGKKREETRPNAQS